MKKLLPVTIIVAWLCCGCNFGPLERLGNVMDHCGPMRGETGWANFGFQCVFEENPLDTLPLFTE